MKFPKVGVVVLTCNAEKHIRECLDSLSANKYPNFGIMVVDNASEDGTTSIIEKYHPSIHLVKNHTNLGYAKGCNIGIKFFLGRNFRYVLLLNDDTVVDHNLISFLVKPFLGNNKIGICGPVITYFRDPAKIWFAGGYFNRIFCYTRHNLFDKDLAECSFQDKETDFISGCCLMIKTDVLEKIGMLFENYEIYFEDTDFCIRAGDEGYICWLVAQPLLRHRVSATMGSEGSNALSKLRAYYYARNPFIFIKKETRGLIKLTNLLGQFFIRLPYYTLQMLRQRAFNSIVSYFRGIRDGLKYLMH